MLALRRPRPEDPALLAADIRGWDAVECAMHGVTAEQYVREWLTKNPGCYAATLVDLADDAVLAMGGVREYAPGMGRVWMLGTNRLARSPRRRREWVRLSRALMDGLAPRWAELSNYIPAERHESRRWLSRLGFDFGPAFVHVSGVTVAPFCWKRGHTAREEPAAP